SRGQMEARDFKYRIGGEVEANDVAGDVAADAEVRVSRDVEDAVRAVADVYGKGGPPGLVVGHFERGVNFSQSLVPDRRSAREGRAARKRFAHLGAVRGNGNEESDEGSHEALGFASGSSKST